MLKKLEQKILMKQVNWFTNYSTAGRVLFNEVVPGSSYISMMY
jgi:hypothetical protein